MKTFLVFLFIALLFIGCFHEWPDDIESEYKITEGPLVQGGYITNGGYQNCINIINTEVYIESNNSGVTINGVTSHLINDNGDNWVWLDVSLPTGETFIILINGKKLEYEVI